MVGAGACALLEILRDWVLLSLEERWLWKTWKNLPSVYGEMRKRMKTTSSQRCDKRVRGGEQKLK